MPPNWESSSAVFVCKRKDFAQHLGVLGRHCVHFANGGILFKDHLAVACGEDLQRVAAADALGAAGSRCGKLMHIFSFRAVRACILWAKHWTAPAAAAVTTSTGPSAAASSPGGRRQSFAKRRSKPASPRKVVFRGLAFCVICLRPYPAPPPRRQPRPLLPSDTLQRPTTWARCPRPGRGGQSSSW
jgi:hypothetical protein